MVPGWCHSSKLPVGVDVGGDELRLVQLDGLACRPRVIAAIRIPRPFDRDPGAACSLRRRLRADVRAAGFTTRRCVISLARDDVHSGTIRLSRGFEPVPPEAVSRLAARSIGLEPGSFDVRTDDAASDVGDQLLVTANRRTAVAPTRAMIEAVGLRPIAIEPAFAALTRFLDARHAQGSDIDPRVRIVVDLGWTGSSVLIVRGGRVKLLRSSTIGRRAFDRAVARRMDLTEEAVTAFHAARGDVATREQTAAAALAGRVAIEAARPIAADLAKEIVIAVRAYGARYRGPAPCDVIIVDSDPRATGLTDEIEARLHLPVVRELAPDLGLAPRRFTGARSAAAWCVAAGLSLRGREIRVQGGADRSGLRSAA